MTSKALAAKSEAARYVCFEYKDNRVCLEEALRTNNGFKSV